MHDLISRCKSLGLPEKGCMNANSFLEHNELGLAFDTILTQMYEYDILLIQCPRCRNCRFAMKFRPIGTWLL
jgi:hypothetical protein